MARRNRFFSDISYKDPNPLSRRGQVSRYAGIPAGVQLFSEWNVQYNPFRRTADLDATNDWTFTAIVGAGTATLSDDLWPPHLQLLNGIANADNEGAEIQHTGAGGTGESVSFLAATHPNAIPLVYFETMIRVQDALGGGDDNSVQQSEWFVGLANTSATLIAGTGVSDYIGFRKSDVTDLAGNGIFLNYAGAGAGTALRDVGTAGLQTATGWTMNAPAAVLPNTTAGRRAARVVGPNEWVRLAFLARGNDTAAGGFQVYTFVNGEHRNTIVNTAATQVPDEEMCISLGTQNGEADDNALNVAYVLLAQKYEI